MYFHFHNMYFHFHKMYFHFHNSFTRHGYKLYGERSTFCNGNSWSHKALPACVSSSCDETGRMVVPYGEARALLGGGGDSQHHDDWWQWWWFVTILKILKRRWILKRCFSSRVQVPVQLWPRDGRTWHREFWFNQGQCSLDLWECGFGIVETNIYLVIRAIWIWIAGVLRGGELELKRPHLLGEAWRPTAWTPWTGNIDDRGDCKYDLLLGLHCLGGDGDDDDAWWDQLAGRRRGGDGHLLYSHRWQSIA